MPGANMQLARGPVLKMEQHFKLWSVLQPQVPQKEHLPTNPLKIEQRSESRAVCNLGGNRQ